MVENSVTADADVAAVFAEDERKSLLRFITCGSVDDGKSTLIGRLLYESKTIFEDHWRSLERDSARVGTRQGQIDFALLVDGLAAEREQGITIDVAYRFFSTRRRKFIVADTPGHEQYTRNMVTGASGAELAVVLIDARKGVLVQTRRHSFLVSLLGIRHVVLAVNKMDLVDFDEQRFNAIVEEYRVFASRIGLGEVAAIPLVAVDGDNIIESGTRMPWYRGPTLLEHLEHVDVESRISHGPLRLPVQWVNRPNAEFRGFAGSIAAGVARVGDAVRILPSGRTSRIARIVTADGDLPEAVAGRAVTLTLADEVDVSRGDVIAAAEAAPESAAQFQATIIWMHEEPLLPARSYLLKIGGVTANATVMPIRHRINVNTLDKLAAETLELNDIGVCELQLDRPVVFEPYVDSRTLGGFILIDRMTFNTVGAGLMSFALRRASNLHWQALDVTQSLRAELKGQKPAVLWLTGLSGAGKSTIANLVEKRLAAEGRHTYLLDGDNVRHGLNKDLGFTEQDRVENIRRVGEVARLMTDAGLIVLVSFISPFRAERSAARSLFAEGEFLEVFIDTSLAEAERRDVKGLYGKARRGELKNFTGIDSPYEPPENPELRIDTQQLSPAEAADLIVEELRRRGLLSAP
ncbi:MAG: sulfate adenylyltransferase subunit CysN [Sinobacteraceae bacterium]|nr:sulfate adenylyltransferase subunit CysN [Nevskiaceae bacterium]